MVSFRILVLAGFACACGSSSGSSQPDAGCSLATIPGTCDREPPDCPTEMQMNAMCQEPQFACQFLSVACCTCGPQGWNVVYIECRFCPDATPGPVDASPVDAIPADAP